MSDKMDNKTKGIIWAAGMILAAPFSGGLSLLAVPLAIPIAMQKEKREESRSASASSDTSSHGSSKTEQSYGLLEMCPEHPGHLKTLCQVCSKHRTRRASMNRFDLSPMVVQDEFYCHNHMRSRPCWECNNRIPQSYFNTSVYSPPSPEVVLADRNPNRTAVLIENLSTDRLAEKFVGVAERFADKGRGTRIRIRRTGGWFSQPGLDIDIDPK